MEKRTRLHELLIALIKKDAEFELIDDDSVEFLTNLDKDDPVNFSKLLKKNRKILKRYQSLVRSAVTLDALMDSENEENYTIR